MVICKSRRAGLLAGAMLLVLGAGEVASNTPAPELRPSGAFGAYLSARFAVQSRDLGFAANEFEQARRDDPGIPELNSQAFLAALLAGQPEAARLAASLPDNPLAQLVVADRDGRTGRWAEAEAHFVGLVQDQVLMQVLRPLLLAWAQQGAGHTDAALNTLAPLIEGTRFRGVYALHAALIADQAGRLSDAARLYQIAAANYGPINLRLGVILASWQARHGQVADAQRTINDLAASDGDIAMARSELAADSARPAVNTAADGIAEAYLALAATLRQQGNDSAQVMIQLALDMRPDFTAARIILSDIEAGAAQTEAALATLAKVPASDPLASLIALRRAALLQESGQTDPAVQLLEKLAREHPGRAEPLAQLGDIYRRKNRFADAAQAYTRAIARLGTPSRANWSIFYARGIADERAGDWGKAEPDFKYALELAPDQPGVLNYLAYSWAERGEHLDEARQMLERALSREPNEAAFLDSLGWVLLRQGDKDGATKQLEHAVEIEPEDPVINGHFGDALAASGRMREAEFQWRRALNLKPDEQDAKKLNEKIAALPDAHDPAAAGSAVPR